MFLHSQLTLLKDSIHFARITLYVDTAEDAVGGCEVRRRKHVKRLSDKKVKR